ncbi:hypothetical protein CYMTET_22986 [Cymbomonas tetramitiformis]|uniref:Uncharacterized protein n=1 Tax=Cymbomonas tetramitiformis TaxID=36881 RepID=A0AAE0L1R3_9CHLO|nr:hypothetical protein CYMTET_22986 [Cymbomonas tetramitiformis]
MVSRVTHFGVRRGLVHACNVRLGVFPFSLEVGKSDGIRYLRAGPSQLPPDDPPAEDELEENDARMEGQNEEQGGEPSSGAGPSRLSPKDLEIPELASVSD